VHHGSGGGVALDRELLGGTLQPELLHHRPGELGGVERLEPVGAGAGLHPTEVEKGLHEAGEPAGGAGLGLVVAAPRLRGQAVVLDEHLRELRQGGQGRAELVGDGGNEIGLKPGDGQLPGHGPSDQVGARDHQQGQRRQPSHHEPPALSELEVRLDVRVGDDHRPGQAGRGGDAQGLRRSVGDLWP